MQNFFYIERTDGTSILVNAEAIQQVRTHRYRDENGDEAEGSMISLGFDVSIPCRHHQQQILDMIEGVNRRNIRELAEAIARR